jgi:hypothetical protein
MTALDRNKGKEFRLSRRAFVRTGAEARRGVAAARNSTADRRRAGADAQRRGRKRRSVEVFRPGAPLVEPEVRRSSNGVLETTLRMRYAWKTSAATASTCARTRERFPDRRCG